MSPAEAEALRRENDRLRAELAARRGPDGDRDRAALYGRAILDSATDYAIIATDPQGLIADRNRGAREITGWSREEMLGRPLASLFGPQDLAAGVPEAEIRDALAVGRADSQGWRLRHDGSLFWAHGSLTPLRDGGGAVTGFLKILRDRTAEHRTAEALREIDERYRIAARATSDAIWDWDLRSNHIRWNEALKTAYGHDPDAVAPTGDWWIAQIHPGDRARIEAGVRAAIEGGDSHWSAEYRFRRADGSHADVLDRGFMIRDPGGRAERMIGAMLDLSERKRAEAELRGSEDRLRLATEAARLGIYDYRPQTGQLTWDGRCRALFGAPAGGPVGYGDSFLRVLHPEDRENTDAAVRAALDPRGDGRFAAEYRVIDPRDGQQRWISATGLAFFEEDVPMRLIGTVMDISDLKRAEAGLRALNDTLEERVEARTRALREAEEQLRQSQKMAAVGQLTGGLAHDFNNLLAGISGSLEMMRRRLAQGRVEEVDRYMLAAQGAAARAAALTHRLLAFSRRQTLDPRPTDMNRLVTGMEELVRRTVGPAVRVETVLDEALWTTLCDPNQLENALLNLCINARDAMPGGGRLTISTVNRCLDARTAALHDTPSGQYVVLCVADSGTGMAPEVVARAFDPFFTTKPMGQGTGLGLSMIYGFARQSGGFARLSSEPGRGTTATLFLPRHPGPAEAPAAPAPSAQAGDAPAGDAPRRLVLVVDDEPSMRMLLAEVLGELGYAVLEAGDSVSGLRVLQSAAAIDLLITDVGLPGGMNGRQLAEAVRDERPAMKVLFITGYAENAVFGNGMLEPGTEIMTKPFAMETLARRVRTLLGD